MLLHVKVHYGLPKQLQGSKIEIIWAYELVSLITYQLQDIRDNVGVEFKAIIEKCVKIRKLFGKLIKFPELTHVRFTSQM